MEKDVASLLSKAYHGDMVSSSDETPRITNVQVKRLNNLLVKVIFDLDGKETNFRAMVSEQNEGTLLLVQEKVSESFIISGVSGFLYKKPNVHGGYVERLNSFYFHIMLDYFNGEQVELYFFGKEDSSRTSSRMDLERVLTTSGF